VGPDHGTQSNWGGPIPASQESDLPGTQITMQTPHGGGWVGWGRGYRCFLAVISTTMRYPYQCEFRDLRNAGAE